MPRRCAKAGLVLAVVWTASALLGAGVAQAASADPLFAFTPQPPPPPAAPKPPPTGYLNGPCGLAVDSTGQIYVSDYYHDSVDVFSPGSSQSSLPSFQYQRGPVDPLDGPCGLALDPSGNPYINDFHRKVERFSPSFGSGALIDSSHPTGVAIDGAGNAYVDEGDRVVEYDSSGAKVKEIGLGDLGEGYGVAVSGYSGTEGRVYVPDAATNTVKVYDPSVSTTAPVDEIKDPYNRPFVSLRDSAIAVDNGTGRIYFADETQPADAEQPQASIYVYSSADAWLGFLRYRVVDALPPGLAVDNSGGATQGRVYVTSGNTNGAGIYAYPPGVATVAGPIAPSIPGRTPGGGPLNPTIPIGGAAIGSTGTEIACEGDACQVLPPEPVDPTLDTLLTGHGNPKVRYGNGHSSCAKLSRNARKLRRRAHRLVRHAKAQRGQARRLRGAAGKLRKRAKRLARAAKRCARARRGGRGKASAAASSASGAGATGPQASAGSGTPGSGPAAGTVAGAAAPAATAGLLPGSAGFGAEVSAPGGAPAQAGSHPYRAELDLALDQSGGEADLRSLRIAMPPGLLADPAVTSLCTANQLATHRSSPFEASKSGESCPDRSQVGAVEVQTGLGGETRRFGLFELSPPDGAALELGASPFGVPLRLDGQIDSNASGTYLVLSADVPQGLKAHSLKLSLWGTPWDASHNAERGNCLNEAEPSFAWCKSSIGEPLAYPPKAFLTLPGECSATLAFRARVDSWQGGTEEREAVNRDSEGHAVALEGCGSLEFAPHVEGLLSTTKASTSSGYVFRLRDEDPGLADPRSRIHALPKQVEVRLPEGVTMNPSLGAGLEGCTPAELASASAASSSGGCPNGSKIGVFSLQVPFYYGTLEGSIYLAAPRDNPFGSLLAVYLVGASAQRGILISAPGKLVPDPNTGTITAVFDDLPQLPYTNLEVNFRSGQRAPLVTPASCGAAPTTVTVTPWAQGAPTRTPSIDTQIESGIGGGPCPTGPPPFSPEAIAGGVNSNVNSYTPYFVHLKRSDTEAEITSYSLILPKGITGKLAGIPFCPDAAIDAARGNGGFAETANSSCPAASQVGRTLTGYGVGSALTYAPGRMYLAGPYHGSALSLVTINAATVGPFDLGTIVVRSAFDVDRRTAQLQIDSAGSDPIPHIIDGIPLHLRDVRVYMDRHEFTHNPSSCEPSALESTLTGSAPPFTDPHGSTAQVSKHFQLLNCLTLGFKPKLGLRLRGNPRRGGFPALRATFAARGPKDSNLKRIEVDMPHQLFLAQNHIRKVCTRVQFSADRCPAGSIYGRAVAYTPLLDQPLTGNVYLRSSNHKLPDLVTSLHSGSIRIDLVGRIGPSKKGGIQAFFDNVPDAPINRFVMLLRGGKHGLLTNSVNICKSPPAAEVKALGQNNIGSIFASKLRGQCHKGNKKRHRRHHHKRKASR